MAADFRDNSREVRQAEELDAAQLVSYLRSHLAGTDGDLKIRQFPAGHSNLTYSVTFGSHEMVLRRPPFGSKVKSAHDMGREYHVLSRLHGVYPAPRPLLYCTEESVIGAPFYLMERVRGVVLRRNLPEGFTLDPATTRRLSERFIDNLAALHTLDYNAIGLGELGKPAGYLERQVKGWMERYHGSKTEELPEIDQISAWLSKNMPTRSDSTLIHNDYKYDNMILAEEDVTRIKAVLDWEMCTLGDPLTDLGTALAYWVNANDPPQVQMVRWGPTTVPGSLTRQELARRYSENTGRSLDHILFYYVFALFKVAVIIQQIYYRYYHGLTKDQRFATLGEVARMLLQVGLGAAQRGSI